MNNNDTWSVGYNSLDKPEHTHMLTNAVINPLALAVIPASNDCVEKLAKTQKRNTSRHFFATLVIGTSHLRTLDTDYDHYYYNTHILELTE